MTIRSSRWRSATAFVAALVVAAPVAVAAMGQVPAGRGGATARPGKPAAVTGAARQAQAAGCGAPVPTDAGVVCGLTRDGWREYLGIPYAAPPTGGLRWQPPQPHAPWPTPYQATQPGPHCYSTNLVPGPSPSEDCLWLSVYVPPETTASSRLPVMVWIHGGAFRVDDDSGNGIGVGTGSGQELADREHVVVVRISYRLGALGFLASSVFGAKLGNYGLEDQQVALQWVKRNVSHFGGKPGNVTLFGQSAGATSICVQLISPGSRDLFQRAIIQSGWYQKFFSAASCSQQLPTLAQAEATASTLASRVGCESSDVAACLRGVPAAKLLAAGNGLDFAPVLDGQFVPSQPQTAFASGRFTHVPVIVGVNRNEGLPVGSISWSGYTQMLRSDYGSHAGRVLASYPPRLFPSATVAAGAVVSDQMVCSALAAANRLARWVPTYMYRWDDMTEPYYFTSTPGEGNILAGAYHSAELAALFPGWALPPSPQLTTPDQTAIIDTAMTYWGAFAHDGTPTTEHALPWPPYQDNMSVMSLQPAYDSEVLHADNLRQTHHCSLWENLGS